MPTYEYSCPNGHRFDRFQKMSDPPEAQCPECGEPGERQISAGAGFLFKGEGFYITDYRSPDYKAKDRAESGKDEGAAASKGKPSHSAGGGDKAAGTEKASEKPASGKSSTSGAKDA
jgi:putative FmdB family regulatory protein